MVATFEIPDDLPDTSRALIDRIAAGDYDLDSRDRHGAVEDARLTLCHLREAADLVARIDGTAGVSRGLVAALHEMLDHSIALARSVHDAADASAI